jgi:citrate lyase subunit beta/citryl-CoA lyase
VRSKLFVPASRPELFAKALASDADALSFDLEDAVADSRKDSARNVLAEFLRTLPPNLGKVIIVRVNSLATSHGRADLEAVVGPWLDLINQPKCDSPEAVREFVSVLEIVESNRDTKRPGVLVNIETPRALRLAASIATASPRVAGLQLGLADLMQGLHMQRDNPSAVEQIQLSVRLAAAEAGVFAYDGAFPNINDADGYRREAEGARRLGFLGKSAIHPRQVPIANEIFSPTVAEVSHARQIVDASRVASEKGIGAYTVNGCMIDAPIVKSAERVLALAKMLSLIF